MKARVSIVVLVLMLCGGAARQACAQPPAALPDDESVRLLINRLERLVQTGDAAGYIALQAPGANQARAQCIICDTPAK